MSNANFYTMNIRLEKPREFLNYNFPKGKTVKNIRINKISEIESIEINILPNFMWEKITSKFITPLQKLYELESDVLPFDILRKGYKLVNDDSNIFIQIRFKNKVKNLEIFTLSKNSIIRVVIPPSQSVNLLYQLNSVNFNYYIDWGGALIWMEIVEDCGFNIVPRFQPFVLI